MVVAVSEGVRDEQGIYISAKAAVADKFGHPQLSGVGKILENIVKQELHIKVRSVELNILQRCAAHLSSRQDLIEAEELGCAAVRFAEDGRTGFMTSIRRIADEPYDYKIETSSLEHVANEIRKIPSEWINDDGNDVTNEMVKYIYPLIQGEITTEYENGIPKYIDISHILKNK